MNDFVAAILLGIIEGLTEFLPVSSTAHLRIAQELMQQDPTSSYWKMFAIVIQLGAILSVVFYFRNRLVQFLRSYPKGLEGKNNWWNHPLALVIISFVVTAVPCYLIDKKIGENLESLSIMGWALIIGGVVMWGVDRYFSQRATTESIASMSLFQAIVVGFAQIFAAAFPGTSRSMATIAGGQAMGMTRTAALEFSFFLSIPVMCAATGYKLLQFLTSDETAQEPMDTHRWLVLATGFVVSFLTALGVIAWFMDWVRKHGFVPFAIYRLVAGSLLLVWLATRS